MLNVHDCIYSLLFASVVDRHASFCLACEMTRGLGIKRISQVEVKLRDYSQAEELRSHFGKARESGEYVQNRMNDGDVFLSSRHFDSHSTHCVFRDFGFITWEP